MMQGRKPLTLIIDDEEALRDGCRQTLEKSGYTVLTAGEGIESLSPPSLQLRAVFKNTLEKPVHFR
jgi:CheY-like chemotaxis protein